MGSRMRPALLLPAAGLLLCSLAGGDRFNSQRMLKRRVSQAAPQQALLPQRVLWVWERPEDLHAIDPGATGVAVLEETLRLGLSVVPIMRHQPVLLPERAPRIAVVRIETDPSFASHRADTALLQSAVANLDRISRQPGIAALQIDFDAKKSERGFYRRLLGELRERMPPMLPLDMTALVSWCSTDDWIRDLPVNEATPMFFRMEPDRRRMLLEAAPAYAIHEPLCLRSAGVSTAEPWPQSAAGKRMYLFADHGWARDMATLTLTHSQTSQDPR